MIVVILQDCPDGSAGSKVDVSDPAKARAMIRAGVARPATMRDHARGPMRKDDVRVKGGRNV